MCTEPDLDDRVRQSVFDKAGGADGIRTHDLLDAIEARSQLRHGPTGDTLKAYHTPPRNNPSCRPILGPCSGHQGESCFR